MQILEAKYDYKKVEEKWNKLWEEQGYYRAKVDFSKPYFSIALPPPNITGSLHMGHAVNAAIQDTLIRLHRMKGLNVLWMPGTDHAGIATQFVVEKELKKKEGKTRHDLGREEFIKRVWEWKEKYGNTIIEQLKRLGASLDYSRARFTMDAEYTQAIRHVFYNWYQKGYIYRGLKPVNWCIRCLTTLSDLEVEHKLIKSKIYYIYYPGVNNEGVTVATTRPETMLGDVAVAVNPNDTRYSHLIGKKVILPLMNREIPIISDEYVKIDFGTGALKITPAHDFNDFEVGTKHNLSPINVFTQDGVINENGGIYKGLKIEEAREQVIKDLEQQGFLKKIEDYEIPLGYCYRCNTVIEPYLSFQWFVKMEELSKKALQVIKEDKIKFHPTRYKELMITWLENIRDWCISRQLWWGHQIPIWYCNNCNEISSSIEDLKNCPKCQSNDIKQDQDVLDTWFSSALWPYATLGWPQNTEELQYFYPTTVLSTASEILYLWVARMIFSSLDLLDKVPFYNVLIHATILNKDGQRMSKSKGTGVDPLDMIDKYGADACRYWLSSVGLSGQDVRFSDDKLLQTRNFVTKIWNAARLIFMNLEDFDKNYKLEIDNLKLVDKWILTGLKDLIDSVNYNLEKYNFTEATRLIYDFFWDNFCDWYLEISKIRLKGQDRKLVQYLLVYILDKFLRLLHPFMPFITEELWEHLKYYQKEPKDYLIITQWLDNEDIIGYDLNAKEDMEIIINIIRAIRNLRTDYRVPAGNIIDKVYIITNNVEKQKIIDLTTDYILHLAKVNEVIINPQTKIGISALYLLASDLEVILPLENLIDIEKEKIKLSNEIDKYNIQIEKLEQQLNNEEFLNKASKNVVDNVKIKIDELNSQKAILQKRLENLNVER